MGPTSSFVEAASYKDATMTVEASPHAGGLPLPVEFWANVSGSLATAKISWQFGDGAAGSGTPVVHTFLGAGWYNATATATFNGSSSALTGTVGVHATGTSAPAPFQVTIAPVPSQGNSPLPVAVTLRASGGDAPYSGSVCFGDGTCVDLPSGWAGGALTLNHTYTLAGTFTIVASAADAQGASTSSTAALSVLSPPSLSIYGIDSPVSGSAPLSVTFEAQASGGKAPYTVLWEFGDGTSQSGSVGSPLTHSYAQGGNYDPTLTVTDATGLRATYDLKVVLVQGAPTSTAGNSTGFWTSGWFASHSSELGAVGLVAVMLVFALLVERRRRALLHQQARMLVEAMEKSQEPP